MTRKIEDCKFQKGYKKGNLTVDRLDLSRLSCRNGTRTYYICKCICGKEIVMSNNSLTNSKIEDCGCKPKKDLTNKKFGLITIKKFDGFDTRYGRKRPKWIGICSGCNIEKSFLQEVLLRGDISSCGKCKPKGKKHPRYNHKSDRYNRRDSVDYRKWCKSVFKRDKYKCVCCGKRGWINAHHLNGWNWAIAERFDVSNGVTLCAGKNSCHNDFHKKFGRGNNTKGQFLIYLKQRGSNAKI